MLSLFTSFKDLNQVLPSHLQVCFFEFLCLIITAKLFDSCPGCKAVRMAAIPQGAFAARKVRQAFEMSWQRHLMDEESTTGKEYLRSSTAEYSITETTLEQPMKYSSKLMNSIWGLYNRYSVHNFKKNTDGKLSLIGEHQLNAAVPQSNIPGIFQKQ